MGKYAGRGANKLGALNEQYLQVIHEIFRQRGLDPNILELRQVPGVEDFVRMSGMKGVSINMEWLDNAELLEDVAHRLANITQGKENDWKIINFALNKGKILYHSLGYIVRAKNVFADIMLTRNGDLVYSRIILDGRDIAVLVEDHVRDSGSTDWAIEQEDRIAQLTRLEDILPNPNPLLEDGVINWVQDMDEKLSYKGQELWIYECYDTAYVKSLGWIAVPLSQLRKRLQYFTVELQQEFEMWEALV